MARMLILQEMEQNIINLEEALIPRGHELIIVDRELQALQRLHSTKIDLIISAVYLESSDVFDFLKAVKNNREWNEIPFVLYCSAISTFARSVRGGLKIAAESLGADLYITMEKFDPALLAKQVEECLIEHKISPLLSFDISDMQHRAN